MENATDALKMAFAVFVFVIVWELLWSAMKLRSESTFVIIVST